LARWNRIVENTGKQCGVRQSPKVFLATSIQHLFEQLSEISEAEERRFCCSILPEALPIQKVKPIKTAAHIVIGPAANLTAAEEESFVQQNFELISLGPYTLRSETAAISAVAMVQALWSFE